MVIRICYAKSGTELGYGSTRVCCYKHGVHRTVLTYGMLVRTGCAWEGLSPDDTVYQMLLAAIKVCPRP
eukprot:1948044-Rhodomonas_salina.1